MRPLRILACSDIHGSSEALQMLLRAEQTSPYDLVVMCGDFTTFGTTQFTTRVMSGFKTKVIAVPGNCDVPDTVDVLEASGSSVHNTQVEFGGRRFFGFGGALPGGSDMPFEVEEDIMERSLRSVAVEGGVMVTHMPSYGMNDLTKSGKHGGSRGLLRVAREFKPVLALSGHIHEAAGKTMTKDTTFVNPGPAKNGFYASIALGDVAEVEFHEVKLSTRHTTTY